MTLAERRTRDMIVIVDGASTTAANLLTEELVHKAFSASDALMGQGDSRAFTLLSPSEK
jgi:hypothetical protein